MEVIVENSCLEGDTNAIILPAKKSKKRKGTNQEGAKKSQKPKLSKSQKRKLRKLEEEKERALLLSKSIEALEKYKLPERAFSLLESSRNIGQAQTVKQQQRRAFEFFKAGLEFQPDDQPLKRGGGRASFKNESDAEEVLSMNDGNRNACMQPMAVERGVSNYASVSGHELDLNGGPASASLAEEVSSKDNNSPMQEETGTSLTLCGHDSEKSSKLLGKLDVSSVVALGQPSDIPEGQRPLNRPVVVHVIRPSEVEENRKDLPIVMMEQEIMEAINEHSAIIICGETGCGKTTQIPQFLYEAGFGSSHSTTRSGIIGVTQPRRVAVLATAKRVAFELGLRLGKEVGFQVRHDKRIGDNCSIKFMTDGILLREVQSDILLKRYSVIILDEAHERSVNTDILIGMLSRIIQLRQKKYEEQQQMVLLGQNIAPEKMIFPLKLVLMSATLRVEDFVSGQRLFRDPPPIIKVPARQFPVTEYFSKKTETVDYVGSAYKKVLAIHKKLPQGGILVFVTGQREVEYLCQKLRKASRELTANDAKGNMQNEITAMSEMNCIDGINMKDINEAFDIQDSSSQQQPDRFSSYDEDMPDFNEDESAVSYDPESESELEFDGDGDELGDWESPNVDGTLVGAFGKEGGLASLKAAFEALAGKTASEFNSESKQIPFISENCSEQPKHCMEKKRGVDDFPTSVLHVLPLYAMLPAASQLRVFEEVKEGERLVVVATNVAETSLTIPGIKYVVDTGRQKVKKYNLSNGMERYEVEWISKASAAQRAGRAGRTGPGHCYRLYSLAVFSAMPNFSDAEISKVPADSIVLVLKSMNIDKVENFPFPTPPKATALVEADRCLKTLEALDSTGRMTSLGKAMALYPMSPRHSRMLLTVIQILRKMKNHARANSVLGYAVAAAAALSLRNPFLVLFEGSQSSGNDLKWDGRSCTLDSTLDKQEKLMKQKRKETAKAYHARFSNPKSDSLTVAHALQCFELSKSPVEFCNEYGLHLKTMEEMSKLRKQLLQLVFNRKVDDGFEQDFSWIHGTMDDVEQAWRVFSDKNSLLLHEEELLGQAICAGWADRVAMRIGKHGTIPSEVSEGDRKANTVRYQACMVKETVFLHRSSSLSNVAPDYLVYSELLDSKRPYMHGATCVEPEWLVRYAGSLCSLSKVDHPKPYYQRETDDVFCWVIPTFGPHLWQLRLCSVPISGDKDRVRAFACALLEGDVLPCLKSFRSFMAARPSIILDREALGERRFGNLIFKLNTRLIDSCAKLREMWKGNPQELRSEIMDWFKKSFHKDFEALWSRMLVEAQLDPQRVFSIRAKRDKTRKEMRL